MYDLQKASMWKRMSAALLDFIMLIIVITGSVYFLSAVTGYNNYSAELNERYEWYEKEYNIDISEIQNMSKEQFAALSKEEINTIKEVEAAFAKDDVLIRAYNMVQSLMLVMVTLGVLIAFLILEILVPLIFKNGQTIGKKVFGIGVMRIDGVKLTPFLLFVRAILGKYTIETMIPIVFVLLALSDPSWMLMALIILVLIPVVQIVLMIASKTNSAIHDKLSSTVTVDLASQMIFETQEDLLKFKEQKAQEAANEGEYF